MICLASADRERSGDMMGRIGPDGSFSCRPQWWVDRPDQTRFRICLFPDPRQRRQDAPEGHSEAGPQAVGVAEFDSRGEGAAVPSSRVVLASFGAKAQELQRASARMGGPRGTFGRQSKVMEVSLGAESVRIDIDLED
jgi:hypothetical protein